jgi:hypothetical protein
MVHIISATVAGRYTSSQPAIGELEGQLDCAKYEQAVNEVTVTSERERCAAWWEIEDGIQQLVAPAAHKHIHSCYTLMEGISFFFLNFSFAILSS